MLNINGKLYNEVSEFQGYKIYYAPELSIAWNAQIAAAAQLTNGKTVIFIDDSFEELPSMIQEWALGHEVGHFIYEEEHGFTKCSSTLEPSKERFKVLLRGKIHEEEQYADIHGLIHVIGTAGKNFSAETFLKEMEIFAEVVGRKADFLSRAEVNLRINKMRKMLKVL